MAFSVWGKDVIGRIAPKASNGHEYILVAIDYFTKWVEAASYSILKAKHMARFLENNIKCQFGVPQEIIFDNGSQIEGEGKRVVKAASKNVKNILAKMVVTYEDWAEKLPFTLLGNRTSLHALTGVTPYSSAYGSEAVLPIKVEIQSLRLLVEIEVLEEDWAKARYEKLSLIDEKRARAQYHAQGYQKMIARPFNKKVKSRNLKKEDSVLKVLRDKTFDPR
ncbi:uncharacterized protein LOC142635101 [Castanea sativa]|uniref:uncharacterized protein LOC142635101 n=1 Tax=Castanea sativa TaxID=21020 RepID=UPI003F64FDDB